MVVDSPEELRREADRPLITRSASLLVFLRFGGSTQTLITPVEGIDLFASYLDWCKPKFRLKLVTVGE